MLSSFLNVSKAAELKFRMRKAYTERKRATEGQRKENTNSFRKKRAPTKKKDKKKAL